MTKDLDITDQFTTEYETWNFVEMLHTLKCEKKMV